MRRVPLVTGNVYHVFNRSISKFVIFNDNLEFLRFLSAILYYQREKPGAEFSKFINLSDSKMSLFGKDDFLKNKTKMIEIIAYCLMPTHFHLVLEQLVDGGISKFLNNVQNSYSRYFNIKHNRKGPLWESRFKDVLVDSDEQLLHLTRYLHLNPVKAMLVKKPEDWQMSSYREYLLQIEPKHKVCDYNKLLAIEPASYQEFTNDHHSYQADLRNRKDLFLDAR